MVRHADGHTGGGTLGSGDYFGEIGLLREPPKRTATVRARSTLEVTVLDRARFGDLLESSEAAATSVDQTARARLARKPARARKPAKRPDS